MKRFLSLIVVFALVIACVPVIPLQANAAVLDSGDCGVNVTWTLGFSGTLTISGTGKMTDYDYSSSAPWYNYHRSKIKSVIIEDGVTSIGDHSFYECSSLASVAIPDSVISIGDWAFYECSSLASVTIPDSVTSIGTSAFCHCSSLTSIEVPDSVTSISGLAFSGCSGLKSVTIGNGITSIGYSAFEGCDSLNYNIYGRGNYLGNSTNPYLCLVEAVSDSVISCQIHSQTKIIGDYAFYNRSSLTSIEIPDSVTSIGSYAFGNCSRLTSVVIPDSVTGIGSSAFRDCSSLTSVEIGDGVTIIPDSAFYYCGSLKNITIGDSVTSIGSDAFRGCSSLRSIEIPDSVTSIGNYAFSGCGNLTYNIYDNGKYLGNSQSPYVILVDAVSTSISSCQIHTQTKFVYSSAFFNCSSLASVTIPDSVTSIGSYAFCHCSSLTSIEVPDSVTSIGESAFSGCSSLVSITIPFVGGSRKTASETRQYPFGYIFGTSSYTGGVATEQLYYASTPFPTSNTYYIPSRLKSVTVTGGQILYGAFYNCGNLKSVAIGDSVTSIGDWAFSGCSSLTSVSIFDSVTSIGSCAFIDCTSLTSVTIPDGVTSIGTSAFSGCSSLTSIEIPDSVTSIGERVFFSCSGLESVVIGNSITVIPSYAFCQCKNLTNIVIPGAISSIGEKAFYNCSSLDGVYITDVAAWCKISFGADSSNPLNYADLYLNGELVTDLVIPEGVAKINNSAFESYDSLRSVVIPDSVTTIGASAFSGCDSLTSVTIGNGVTNIGSYAFSFCDSLTGVTIGNSVTSIGNYAFAYSDSLTSIVIPDSVTSIGNYAFRSCTGLTGVTIGNGVTSIGDHAFMNCSSLTSVLLGDSISNIKEFAFSGCSSLKKVFYTGTHKEKNRITMHSSAGLSGATWHYEVQVKQMYGSATYFCPDCEIYYNADGAKTPLQQLTVTSMPEKLLYYPGDTVSLTGISLLGTYSNGTQVTFGADAVDSIVADLSTPGKKTVTVTVFGATTTFEVRVQSVSTVTVDASLYPQSDHNYSNNLNENKTFTYPGALELTITFSSQTKVEANYDYIYVYDGNGNQIAKYTGAQAANQTLTIPGDAFQVKLTTDGSVISYGYSFASIIAKIAEEHVPVIDPATVTCTEAGLSEGSHCGICGEVIVPQVTVPALGHEYQVSFTWNGGHTACTATVTCTRGCGFTVAIDCTVTNNNANRAQTVHTATAEYDGISYTDILTCDNYLVTFVDWNGAEILSTYYHLGNTVEAPTDAVTGTDDAYAYSVTGWDKEILPCTGTTTYTATRGTMTLQKDKSESMLVLQPGMTLDLNGNILTADIVLVMDGATILDGGVKCTGGGKLKVAEKSLAFVRGNGQNVIPVWNGVDGYVFTRVTFQQMARAAENGAAQYIFLPTFSNSQAAAMMADGGLDNGVRIQACMTWDNGQTQQLYTYGDDDVMLVFDGSYRWAFDLLVTGMEDITGKADITDMVANPVVITDSGALATATSIALTAG